MKKKDLSYKEFMKKFKLKDFFTKSIVVIFAIFLTALNYNVIILQQNFMTGGVSGIALLFKNQIDPSIFILIANVILIILSLILLGKEQTKRTLIGAFLYPIAIKLTAYITPFILAHVSFDNLIIVMLICALLDGIAYGLLYKYGFSTGGSEIICNIISKYCNVPTGKATLAVNVIIVSLSGFVIGFDKVIYGVIIIYICSLIIDRIMIGISDSKLFIIDTKEKKKVRDFIINELTTGVTLIEGKGGYLNEKKELIMCVVANKDYMLFKNCLLSIDPDVFYVISDCYEVTGGVKRQNLPFM